MKVPFTGTERGRPTNILPGRNTVIVAAHPDDETIGAGACLSQFSNVVVFHVTDGAPRDMRDAVRNGFSSREAYAAARRQELRDALDTGGIQPVEIVCVGCIDQEASFHLPEIARRLARLIARIDPDLVLVHPFEGGHPDHDAAAFAARAALQLLEGEGPQLMEFTSYHNRAGLIETGAFLPYCGFSETVVRLDGLARARKERMLACYRTQQPVLAQFRTDEERFRPAPFYDFSQSPHVGRLYYEQFPWGMTAARWLALAQEARKALGLW